MDEWHLKLIRELVTETPTGAIADSAATLEVAFGQARGVIAYALELARAHRIQAAGNVAGDRVWLQLGEGRVCFTLNRREALVSVARPARDEARFHAGTPPLGNLALVAREAIDDLVSTWRTLPGPAKWASSVPPEFEDEPTKG